MFDVGLILIYSYLGEDIDQLSRLLGFSLKNLLETPHKKQNLPQNISQFCCLFHYMEESLTKSEESRREVPNFALVYDIEDALILPYILRKLGQIDREFRMFLCILLNLDYKNPVDFKEIVDHPFLKDIESSFSEYQKGTMGPTFADLAVLQTQQSNNLKMEVKQNVFFDELKARIAMLDEPIIDLPNNKLSKNSKLLAYELGVPKEELRNYLVAKKLIK